MSDADAEAAGKEKLAVTLSIGDNALVFDREAANAGKAGYFKAVETANTLKILLSGQYNKAPGDATHRFTSPSSGRAKSPTAKPASGARFRSTILNADPGQHPVPDDSRKLGVRPEDRRGRDAAVRLRRRGDDSRTRTCPTRRLARGDARRPRHRAGLHDQQKHVRRRARQMERKTSRRSSRPQADASVRTGRNWSSSSDNAELPRRAWTAPDTSTGPIPVWPRKRSDLLAVPGDERGRLDLTSWPERSRTPGMSGLYRIRRARTR